MKGIIFFLQFYKKNESALKERWGENSAKWYVLGVSMVAIGGLAKQYSITKDESNIRSLIPVLEEFKETVTSLKVSLPTIQKAKALISKGIFKVEDADKLFEIISIMKVEIEKYFSREEI